MGTTTPRWVRATSAFIGLAIIVSQAAGNYMDGRGPNVPLLIVGGVMVGIISPEVVGSILSKLFGSEQKQPPT